MPNDRWAKPDRIRELSRERFKPWPLPAPVVKPVRDRKPKQLQVGKERSNAANE